MLFSRIQENLDPNSSSVHQVMIYDLSLTGNLRLLLPEISPNAVNWKEKSNMSTNYADINVT